MSKRTVLLFSAALLCGVAIYELPYILTLAKTGSSPLPPAFETPADQVLYLNLSALHYVSPTDIVNPWYGDIVRAVDVPHRRFPVAFFLFHITQSMIGSWTTAMLVWAAIWSALTFAAAAFCLDSFLPAKDPFLIVTGALVLLLLQSPLNYLAQISALPSLKGFSNLHLPFVRFLFPQVVMPFALAYWGLQTRVLKNASYYGLGGMALLQLVGLATFPYILPVIAVGTAISVLIIMRRNSEIAVSKPAVLAFAFVCGLLDIGYLSLVGLGESRGVTQYAVHFYPAMIRASARPYVLLLVVAAALAMFSRTSLAARATVAGLALSHALLAFSDVLVPNSTSMIRVHVNYFLTVTTWLPLLLFVLPFLEKLKPRPLRGALIGGLLLIGCWQGFANYRWGLPYNLPQAAAAVEFQQLHLTATDLVIGPGLFSVDISCQVPLLSPARVLFTRDAEDILSADRIRDEQTLRQAIHLEMGGINHNSLVSLTDPSAPLLPLNPIAQFGDLAYLWSPLPTDNLQVRRMIRERLGPVLAQLDSDPTLAYSLLAGYDRIIIIDVRSDPYFSPSAFSNWLAIDKAYETKELKVWTCHSKFGSEVKLLDN